MNKKEKTKRTIKYWALVLIFTVCLFCSIALTSNASETICDTGCSDNNYTETLGIANGQYGIIIFTILILISSYLFIYPEDKKSYKRIKLLLHSGIIIGSIIAIYFLYLQQFVLKEYCSFCLVIDIGLLVCLGIIIFVRDKKYVTTLK